MHMQVDKATDEELRTIQLKELDGALATIDVLQDVTIILSRRHRLTRSFASLRDQVQNLLPQVTAQGILNFAYD